MHNKSLQQLALAFLFFSRLSAISAAETGAGPSSGAIPPAQVISVKGESILPVDWRTVLAGEDKQTEFGGAEAPIESGTVKFITIKQPKNVYDLQKMILNSVEIKSGEKFLLRFAGRSLKADRDTGSTKIKVGFGKNSPNWDSCLNLEVGLGAEWERFDIPFVCLANFLPKEAKFYVMFGYPGQVAEIADLQLIRYPANVELSALPKSKRYADRYSPEVIAVETKRIAEMRARVDAVKDPAPANGRTLFVEVNGSSHGVGSQTKPFATIQQALDLIEPGDTILVGAGEYQTGSGIAIRKSGKPDAWIKLKAAPGTRPKLISSGWSGIEMREGIAYVEIDGFELEWVPNANVNVQAYGSGVAPMYAAHHIRVLNNLIHGFGTGGIISLDSDYIYLEGNVLHDNAKTSPYGGSCISLCRSFDSDMDPGYHNVIRKNVCYDNELLVSTMEVSGGNGKALTDGNGIIIDVFDRSRANPIKPHQQDRNGSLAPYHGRTLIENNLMYDNGGRGIHVFRSSNVDVVNNTTYMNQKSGDINAGEYTAIQGKNIVFLKNIGYGRKNKRANSQDGSSKVIWKDNLFYNYSDVLWHDGMIDADPMFVAAGIKASPSGFLLKPGSPGLGRGITSTAPAADTSKKNAQ